MMMKGPCLQLELKMLGDDDDDEEEESEEEEEETKKRARENDSHSKKKSKKQRVKDLPIFASAEDYAEYLDSDNE